MSKQKAEEAPAVKPGAPLPPGKMRIHLLVQAAGGPIQSHTGGQAPLLVGTESRWVAACSPNIVMSLTERGTTAPYAVHCAACEQTEIYKQLYRPRPLQAGGAGADLTADGCC